jgi:arabinofuranan 3-O-arabinosyltransferase
VSGIDVAATPGQPGRLPDLLRVDAGPGTGEPQLIATSGPGAGRMKTVRTNQLRIVAIGQAPASGFTVSELTVKRTGDLRHEPAPGTRTGTLCGFGPTVEVAGQTIQTRLRGTLEDVRSGAELAVLPCGGDTLDLAPGIHRVRVSNPSGFAVTDLAMTPSTSAASPSLEASPEPAPVQVSSWSATERRVTVSVDKESVLAVSESYNHGWGATVDGVELEPVVLEGWRQGFVLPAGTTGEVALDYAPQAGFRIALVGGLVLAGLIMGLAVALLLAGARRRESIAGSPSSGAASRMSAGPTARARAAPVVRVLLELVGVGALCLVSLPLALGAAIGRHAQGRVGAYVTWASAVMLVSAALIALFSSAVIVPPLGSELLAALVVGVVCGRASVLDDCRVAP